MITDEQARAAMDALEPDGVKSQYRQLVAVLCKWGRQELARREQHDNGPITAEWLKTIGFSCANGYMWTAKCGDADEIAVCFDNHSRADTTINRRRVGLTCGGMHWRPLTRRQLLALLAALRGELSGNSGQSHAVVPQRAAL